MDGLALDTGKVYRVIEGAYNTVIAKKDGELQRL